MTDPLATALDRLSVLLAADTDAAQLVDMAADEIEQLRYEVSGLQAEVMGLNRELDSIQMPTQF